MTDMTRSPTRQEELWARYAATRDPAIREQLVIQCLDLVQWVVNRLGITQWHAIDRDDLVGEGIIGLIDAIDRFDPDRGIALSTYAVHRIRGQILDALRARDLLPRTARQRVRDLHAAMAEIALDEGRVPTEARLAEYMNLSPDQVQQTMMDASLEICSLDEPRYDSDADYSLQDVLRASEDTEPAHSLDRTELCEALEQAVGDLPDRQRLVLALYYVEELTMKEIGEVMDVSESRVSQLHAQAVLGLRAIMRRDGYLMPPKEQNASTAHIAQTGRPEERVAATHWPAVSGSRTMDRENSKGRRRPGAIAGLLVLLLGLALMAMGPYVALANGTGVTVYLGYLPEVSSWGNLEAEGEAYVNIGEGYLNLQVTGLPSRDDVQYEVWLVPAEDRQRMISVGTFEVDESGAASAEYYRQDLPVLEYRFLVITAEPSSDTDPAPDEKRALAGVFPNMQVIPNLPAAVPGGVVPAEEGEAVTDAGAPVDSPLTAPTDDVAPRLLPVTGGKDPFPVDGIGIALGLLIVLGSGLFGYCLVGKPNKGGRL
ncbi:MAG TPA: FliA/WhiG family RNA polymerase sigma factor [Chloroflexi bacterium]|jgi:RNA polymerase sigma factor for flagellar operon FliA|nr:FliA/WhiG family RNA polymerase sigma factor [Chloroflexota bacterium]